MKIIRTLRARGSFLHLSLKMRVVALRGSEIVSMDLDGENIAIHITHNGKNKIIIYDIKTGELLKEFLPEE